jgi:aldose 1-epimerase
MIYNMATPMIQPLVFERIPWGEFRGTPVEKFIVTDPNSNFLASFTNLGASVLQVQMPDSHGKIGDVHYGRQKVTEFEPHNEGHLGSMMGRVSSLILYARFLLDNQIYHVTPNFLRAHHQHGGTDGFDQKVWKTIATDAAPQEVRLIFEYISPHGEEGYPGTLTCRVIYHIRPLQITYEITAITNRPTLVNMTNHAYWNLDGIHHTVDDLELTLPSSRYVDFNTKKIAVHTLLTLLHLLPRKVKAPMTIKSVDSLGIDFRHSKKLSDAFASFGDIDTNFLLDTFASKKSPEDLVFAARLFSPTTGRWLQISTTEPALVVYSGNAMGNLTIMGQKCPKHGAICLETMKPTNSIHYPDFVNFVILRPDQQYFQKTVWEFGI